jgi:hypothetical protein
MYRISGIWSSSGKSAKPWPVPRRNLKRRSASSRSSRAFSQCASPFRGDDDQCLLVEAPLFEGVEHSCDLVVHVAKRAVVERDGVRVVARPGLAVERRALRHLVVVVSRVVGLPVRRREERRVALRWVERRMDVEQVDV